MTQKDRLKCERFLQVRKFLNLKQQEYAESLKVSQGHISDIENKRKPVSHRLGEILCLKYRVRETWLEDGEGDMFTARSRDDQIRDFINSVLQDEPNSFRLKLIRVLSSLDEEDWSYLSDLAKKLVDSQ